MADLILVRHGQASFGEANYDKLSPLGETQSRLLGRWLRRCGLKPDLIATGTPARQIATASLCLDACGGPDRQTWQTLDGLGEYDHESVVARFRPDYADPARMRADLAKSTNPRRAFHAMYVDAIARWIGGAHDSDYAESWTAFRTRVIAGLRHLTSLDARTILAFTSGGPITAMLQHILALPDARAFDMNWPLVNAGMTRLRFSVGATTTLATYNAHPHLDEGGDTALLTYR